MKGPNCPRVSYNIPSTFKTIALKSAMTNNKVNPGSSFGFGSRPNHFNSKESLTKPSPSSYSLKSAFKNAHEIRTTKNISETKKALSVEK